MIELNNMPGPFVNCYGVPIARFALENFTEHQDNLIKLCNKLKKNKKHHPDYGGKSNQGNFHSANITEGDWNEHPSGIWFMNNINKCLRQTVSFLKNEPIKNITKEDVCMTNSWCILTDARTGFWNSPHDHGNSYLSGAFYLSANPSEDDTLIGMGEFIGIVSNPSIMSVLGNGVDFSYSQTMRYVPIEGELILFPSTMLHMVSPHLAYKDRAMISFNSCCPKAKIKHYDQIS